MLDGVIELSDLTLTSEQAGLFVAYQRQQLVRGVAYLISVGLFDPQNLTPNQSLTSAAYELLLSDFEATVAMLKDREDSFNQEVTELFEQADND